MEREFIGVIDSGVGGLSVLKELVKNLPNESFIYFGDNQNAPYGEKGNRVLSNLCFNALCRFNEYKMKAVVVGCNTLSVNVLENIKKFFDFEIFGVYPPILPPLLKGYNAVLLATPKTSEKMDKLKGLTIKPLNRLAKDIEDNLHNINNINIRSHLGEKTNKFDAIILGCTHYDLIKNEIINHFQPREVYSGVTYTVNKLKEFCKYNKSLVKYSKNRVLFIGENAEINKKFWSLVVKNGF